MFKIKLFKKKEKDNPIEILYKNDEALLKGIDELSEIVKSQQIAIEALKENVKLLQELARKDLEAK